MNRVFMLGLTLMCAVTSMAGAAGGTAAPPVIERLAGDAARTTPKGNTFTAPAGWTVTSRAHIVILDPPEPDSHVAIVDVEATSADAAVQTAWASYRPDVPVRPLKLSLPRSPRDGWEERRLYDYETSPNERAVVFVTTSRAGTGWTVAIVDATEPTFEKRGAPISLILDSLRPKGYQPESFAGRSAQRLDSKRIAQLEEFVRTSMEQLGIPGTGIALIDGGRIVHATGLGVKQLGRPERVDGDTLFAAASNTKALTTLLLAELVDEKKLRWDQPVTDVYPAFRLGDPATTRSVLVKHLVCACTGLPRQDMEWIFEYRDATPSTSLALLGKMQPTSGFGEVYQYSNLMASAAGYVAASVVAPDRELGAAYDDAMRRKIFEPLGMTHTTFDFAAALAGNIAMPHGDDVNGKPSVARMDLNYSVVPHRPAGGVWTSARDLARYVQLELARGQLEGGKPLVSAENILARRAAQVPSGDGQVYGMGLETDTRLGIPVVHHGGSLFGYKSDMIFLPDHGVGAVILTNSDTGYYLLEPFQRRLLELLFDGRPEAASRVSAAVEQKKAAVAEALDSLVIPADPAQVAKLATRYVSAELGTLAVRREASATVFDLGEWQSTVASRNNDDQTVSFITLDPTIDGFEFVVADTDGKRSLVVRDAQHEYRFVAVD